MRTKELDAMIEFSLETLAKGDKVEVARLVKTMTFKWPQAPALSVCFAITNSAFRLESMFDGASAQKASNLAYKLAAILASDVLALEVLHRRQVLCNDLAFYWERTDPYFLNIEYSAESML